MGRPTSLLAGPESRPGATAAAEPRLPRVLVVGAALAGAMLRLAVVAGPLGRVNADEALTALMARHIPADGFPVFVWGQHYGGTAELVPVAASLRLVGWSTIGLRLPNLVLAVVSALVVWRLARRVTAPWVAAVAGLLVWVFPGTALWFGWREQLFYPPTVVLGLVLLLLAYRVADGRRWFDVAGLGLVAGLAFWTSPFMVYFAVPAAAVLVVGLRRVRAATIVFGAAIALAAAVVGALPWLVDNLRTGGASLHAGDAFPVTESYPARVGAFVTDALPGVLGLRRTFTLEWIGGPFGVVAYLAILVALGAGLLAAVRAWRRSGVVPWDAVGLAAYPFVFGAFPFVTNDPIFRYAFFVVPFAVVVGLRPLATLRSARAVVVAGAVVLATATVLSAVSLQQIHVVADMEHDAGIGTVDLTPTVRVLEAHQIDAVYADYWIAYRIPFETEERIVGSPTAGSDRYPPYDARARASDRSAWIVVPGASQDALGAALARLGVGAEVVPAGELTVVIPTRPVLPEEVGPLP